MSETAFDYAELARACGEEWMLGGSSSEVAADNLRAALANAFDDYDARYQGLTTKVPPFTEGGLFEELHRNPHKVKAILQGVGAVLSPAFLALAWRLAYGDEIVRIEYGLIAGQPFQFTVEVAEPGNAPMSFRSQSVRDTRLFRHLGITGSTHGTMLNGFYALKR